ncbi:tripartite tricarboxylate transporter substrate-binding protein [Xenophilus aerolatus]|nr:tripartite tricarboxylate transporter substrate-binding protein [Xenophilus aerolatus]
MRLVVPYAAGGTTDVVARLVGARLARVLERPVVVENRPGGGGTLAGTQVATAAADGLTLLLGGMEIATAPSLIGSRQFLATRDVRGVAGLTLGPLVLVVHPETTEARTLQALIAQCRARPGEFTFASAGIGNVTHLFGEIFKRTAAIDIRHVPYRGAAGALTDLQAGLVTMMLGGTASVQPLVSAGKLRALAITGRQRTSGLPGVPTFAEAGLSIPATDSGAWLALFAPARASAEAIAPVHRAIDEILTQPELLGQLAVQGLVAQPMSPLEVDGLLRTQTTVWSELIAQSGITLN